MQTHLTCSFLAAAILATAASAQTTAPGEPSEAPRPAEAQAAATPGALMDQAANGGSQVYVDDSFASIEKLHTAARYASQGQSQLAITTYQNIIDAYGQKLVYLNNDSYLSITDYVRAKLLDMPAVKSGMYDQLFGMQAKKEIDAAIETRDLPELTRACDQYFPSAAAFAGLSQAAEWHFERADFAAASRIWQQLLLHPAVAARRPDLLFRAAVAESLNGNAADATALHDRLDKEFPDATGTVDGAEVKLLAKLNDIFALPAPAPVAAVKDEWPAFEGGPTRSNLLSVNASIGAQLWTADLAGSPRGNSDNTIRAARVNVRVLNQRRMQQGGMVMEPPLNSYPVLSAGTLLIHAGDRILALSANAGTPLWSYPPQSSVAPVPHVPNETDTVPLQPPSHDSVSVLGDRAYAILPAPNRAAAPSDDEIQDATNFNGSRVVCLSRDDGHELWSTPSRSIKLDNKGFLSFIGSPIVTRQGVFAMARKIGQGSFVQLYLIRLDPDSGAPAWSCYLCSASSGMYYGGFADFSTIPIPTLVDDVLYVATGHGATCAIDANVGRILWLQLNASARKHSPAEYYNPGEMTPSWKFNAPLVFRNKLIAYESAAGVASINIYDRWTGKPLRSLTPKDLDIPSIDVVPGIIDSNLILVGANVVALNLDAIDRSTQPAWTCDFPPSAETGKPAGRPFLTTTGLYIPFEKGVALIDVKAGKINDFWQWPKSTKDLPGRPGNLLVTSEQVVVVSPSEVAGYSRWETARDNRLSQIAAHPNDPEPYLALAEISFRTSHMDIARENMKRAVDFASASHTDSASDELSRLYRTNLNFAQQLLEMPDADTRDQSRFFFEQCKATARAPEQQAEWRIALSDLSLAQSKPEEAATLFNEVLTDPSMRLAAYHRGDALSRAGITAELKFRALIQKYSAPVYQRFEDQAAALLATGQAQRDPVILQQVIDSYPNSNASVRAATLLVTLYRDKQDWLAELKTLQWVYPHAPADAKPQVIADLAQSQLALKRYSGALAWTERGIRQYKDFSWTDPLSHDALTFAKLRDQLHASNSALGEGRRPILPPGQLDSNGRPSLAPLMDEASAAATFASGMLMVPLEQSPLLRRPDKIFVATARSIRIFDTAAKDGSTPPTIALPQFGALALLGSVGEISVFTQARTAIGINVQTHSIAWQIPLPGVLSPPQQPSAAAGIPQGAVFRRRIIIQGGGQVIVNGNVANFQADDQNAAPTSGGAPDPEVNRQNTFARLGALRFSTMRIISGKLMIAANGELCAFDIATGKPKWQDASGAPLWIKLPAGTATLLAGNDDVIVAEIDSPDRNATSFFVLDAETGKFRKQINLDDERVQWRSVGDDGELFAVTDQSVLAYDLLSDNDTPLWRRTDIQSRFPAATVLALDGLILVNANSELMCLSKDGGEVRWPTASSGPIRLSIPDPSFLRASLDGDIVIYQSVQGILAYYTDPQETNDDQVAWIGSITPGQIPPLDSFQISDPYVAVLAAGPSAGGVQHSVRLILINRKGGRIHLIKNIQHSANLDDPEGPVIAAWQVVDNGIAMQVNNTIHFYHAKSP